jgi:hypothetical protein
MKPRVYVDFNEMLNTGEVLLSQGDTCNDSSGSTVEFYEGKFVSVYMDDIGEDGAPDNLIADGVAVLNQHNEWAAVVKWILKIDAQGIRHESDELRA